VQSKRYQRQVVYSHVDASFVAQLQATIAAKAQELLESLNTDLSIAKNKSKTMGNENLRRVGFGMYYFENKSTRSTRESNEKHEPSEKDEDDG